MWLLTMTLHLEKKDKKPMTAAEYPSSWSRGVGSGEWRSPVQTIAKTWPHNPIVTDAYRKRITFMIDFQ